MVSGRRRGVLGLELGFRFFEERQHAGQRTSVGAESVSFTPRRAAEQRLPVSFRLGQLLGHCRGGDVRVSAAARSSRGPYGVKAQAIRFKCKQF